jgi:hypothetical protein
LIDIVRADAWLSKPITGATRDGDKPVPTNGDTLLQCIRMRNHPRRAAAERFFARVARPTPSGVRELFGMFAQLSVMRDVDGMVGRKCMTPSFIRDGVELFGWQLAPHEVAAISQLDLAQLHPGEFTVE